MGLLVLRWVLVNNSSILKIVLTSITATKPHIIPKSIQQQAALGSTKSITKSKIVLGESTISDINNVEKSPQVNK